jgi:hypothetical protein
LLSEGLDGLAVVGHRYLDISKSRGQVTKPEMEPSFDLWISFANGFEAVDVAVVRLLEALLGAVHVAFDETDPSGERRHCHASGQ